MTHRTLSAEAPARAQEPQRVLDEWSMRLLELGIAGIALLAAVLLTVVR